ncbi:MAG: response regulator [Desulfobacterales bacterium]|nr:response regulator [Desulfobacterales bacterium]
MKKKILVVDNHPVMLKFMANLLEKERHEVLTAKDGVSALHILKTYTPDVIFVDLIMPNINGKKLCQIIRGMPNLKDAYLIVLSAVAIEEGEDFAEFGANACIAKGPFNKMAQHVLYALDQSDQRRSGDLAEKTLGGEGVYPREITRELLSVIKHFQVILEGMAEGILEITPEARIVYANPISIALTGMPEEKLLGSHFIELFSETDRQMIEDMLKTMEGKPQTISEESTVNLHGKQIVLKMVPISRDEHTTVVILNDVTEKKRMKAQLLRTGKIEAIGTLAGGIAHDFNNLLMGIQGNISLMLLNIPPTHPHYERLTNIEKMVQSGSKLTSQLLGYARKGKYEVKAIDLNQLVEETSYTFGRTRKEINIHRELAEDLFPIEADQGQIEQVLLNLYINAADAMSGGGDLILKTENVTHNRMKGSLYDPKPGNYVLLTVTDTGAGMDEETMKRIFDPFFTTKEMGRGTGLGLASVYGIIKAHSGYIDVDSRKGQETTFRIYLPATGAKRKAQRGESEKQHEMTRGKETILFVDDEDMIIDVSQEVLKTLGYKVLLARGGREAVEIYEKNKDKIDIVILDMVMPNMGGGQVYDRLKEINPNIKVLLSSGYSIDGQASEILERGCNGFIQKPFNVKQLSESIRSIVESA